MSEQETSTTAPEAPEATPVTDTAAPEATTVSEPVTEPDDVSTFDPEKALAKIRKQNAENATLRAAKKAAEEKAQTNQSAADEAATLREKLMRAEVALELGLSMSLAKRLQGTTPEEMKIDAEEMLADMVPKSPPKSPRPVESLQPGSGKADNEPTLTERITAAQKSGDWSTAMALKTAQLAELATPH